MEAKLKYCDSFYQIIRPGTFVYCAVTGQKIPLEQVMYWSVDRQEAYLNAQVSMQRELMKDGKYAS